MKQLFTTFLTMAVLVMSILSVNADDFQLPDSGFEKWNGSFNGEPQLDDWHAANVNQSIVSLNTISKVTGRTGNAAKIANCEVSAVVYKETTPGYFTLGNPWQYVEGTDVNGATGGTDGGITFAKHPDSMYVWVKREGASENFSILFYSWKGTSKSNTYQAKGGGCTNTGEHQNEESDIRQLLDKNACGTNTLAKQVAEGWYTEQHAYSQWTQIKIPIFYLNEETPDKCNVIFSSTRYPNFRSAAGIVKGNSLTVDDVELIYSSKIQKLYVNNKEWKGFDPDKTEQTYSLGEGATTMPDVYAVRGAGSFTNFNGGKGNFPGRKLSGSECTIKKGQVDGEPTTITVKSEDGKSTTTYKINFVSKTSNNARLSDIRVNGETVKNFNGYLTTYNVALPYGTIQVPEVTATAEDGSAQIAITQATSVNGKATIVVTAGDGTTKLTYTISFSVEAFSDVTLKNIFVNGSPVPGFQPSKAKYTVSLPLGTTSAPAVTWESAYAAGMQKIELLSNTLDGGAQIKVSIPGGTATKTYTLTYKIEASSYSYLAGISIDGKALEGFEPEKTSYTITLPMGATSLPAITWTTGDAYQKVKLTEGGVDGVTRIEVTAASGATTTYRLTFQTEKSSNNALAGIALDGTTLETFHADTLSYSIILPAGTTNLPQVTFEQGDAYQTVSQVINQAQMTVRLTVTAGDGSTRVYMLRFEVEKSANALLQMIYLNGTELEGFDPETLSYSVAWTESTMPKVTVKSNSGQAISIAAPAAFGTVRIIVTPEDGAPVSYSVLVISPDEVQLPAFPEEAFPANNNAKLTELYIGGEKYEAFDPATFTYTYELPWRTQQVPAVVPVAATLGQTITVEHGRVNSPTVIKVLADDKTTKATYTINFPVKKSSNTKLESVEIEGADFTFDPDTKAYTNIVLPYGSSEKTSLTVTRAEEEQSLTIIEAPVGKTSFVTVTAEDGTQDTYSFRCRFAAPDKSNELQSIVVDGVGALDLSQGTNITVDLPYGTTDMKIMSVTKNYPEQEVRINRGGIYTPTTITVKSLNPNEADKVYTLTPNVNPYDPAMLTDLKVGGTTLPQFKPDVFNYVVSVESKPDVTFTAQEGAETDTDANDKYVKIIVEDGEGSLSHTYMVTFYYPGDLTFDLGFETWQSVKNDNTNSTGKVPKGWYAPINAETTGSAGTYYPENATQSISTTKTEGKNCAELATTYLLTSAESMPGFLSLSKPSVSVGKWILWVYEIHSTLAFGAPITFRNTPDQVQLDYNLQEFNKVTGWRFIYNANGMKQINHAQTFSSMTKNKWQTLSQDITYPNDYIPLTLDILISSAQSDNLEDYYVSSSGASTSKRHTSRMYVDNLRLNYNSQLTGLSANGVALTPSGNTYATTVDAEFYGTPKLAFTHAVADQMPVVNWSEEVDGVRTATIRNFGENLTSYTDYTLTVTRPKSTKTTCEYALNGLDLTVTKGSPYQTIAVTENDTAYVITVTAESGDQAVYYASWMSAAGIHAATTHQEAEQLPVSGESTAQLESLEDEPVLNFSREYALDSIAMTVTDTCYFIHVYGSSNDSLYVINRNASHNALLASMSVNNASVPNFYAEAYDYVIATPSLDAFEAVPQDDNALVRYTTKNIDAENAAIFVLVTAQDGVTQQRYSVLARIHDLGTEAYLTSITADDALLPGFSSDKFEYAITLPSGSSIPQLASVACTGATVDAVSTTSRLEATVTYTVTSEDQLTTNSYKVQITIAKSPVCTLDGIDLGATPVEGFVATQNIYNIELPYGTTSLPEVNYYLTDKYSKAELSSGEMQVKITVTAEDGEHTADYVLNFTIAKSTNADLKSISLDGEAIANFFADEYAYTINLPYGATIPVVTAEADDENAKVVINDNNIVVTAEDGVTTHTYTVTFNHLPSTNAALLAINLNGTLQNGFATDIYEYQDTVAYGTPMPVISWTTADEQQKVDTTWVGETELTITVTAGDGESVLEYVLTFIHLLSPNCYLSDLQTGGVTVEGFRRDSFTYVIVYPVDTDSADLYTVDDIKAIAEENDATVSVTQEGDVIQIFVTAPDGTSIKVYTITQTIRLSSEARLKMIWLDDVELRDYDQDTYTYTLLIAQGASVPEITAEPLDKRAEIALGMEADIENGKSVELYCTAPDNTTVTYVLNFQYADWAASSNVNAEDCLFYYIGNGQYKAVTIGLNVKVAIYDVNGSLQMVADVPTAEPADVEVEIRPNGQKVLRSALPSAAGVVYSGSDSKPQIYVFYDSKTKRVGRGGKFFNK